MIVKLPEMQRVLAAAAPEVRLYLFYGPDESASTELANSLTAKLGPDTERLDMAGAQLKEDPARLADEAAAFSMFGGRLHIRVTGSGDELVPAVSALLDLPATNHAVTIVTGTLRKDGKLFALCKDHPLTRCLESYVPTGRDATTVVRELAQLSHLRIDNDVATRLAEMVGNDRALIAREIEKYALYLDAHEHAAPALTHDVIDLLGADNDEGNLGAITNAVFGGELEMLAHELDLFASASAPAAGIIRVLMRRAHLLLGLAQDMVARGCNASDAVEARGKAIFWKDKEAIKRQLIRWPLRPLETAHGRLLQLERDDRGPQALGMTRLGEELFTLARQAARAGRR
jgi:DNA polymerase-3 subunit delta